MNPEFKWFIGAMVFFVLLIAGVFLERDLTNSVFGISRYEVVEKIQQCEADLPRNQRCKVVVTVEKP